MLRRRLSGYFWCLLIVLRFASATATSSTELPITNRIDGLQVGQRYPDPTPTKEVSFLPVVYMSTFNSVVNIMRPDPSIFWQARIPRAFWEICIAIIAKSATDTSNPSVSLLLCLMLVPTALMDIFVWAPSFAMFASFESCTDGGIFSRQPKVCTSDYVNGVGRLFVSIQSLVTGVFYLFAAVVSWTVYAESRDSSIAKKNAMAMAEMR